VGVLAPLHRDGDLELGPGQGDLGDDPGGVDVAGPVADQAVVGAPDQFEDGWIDRAYSRQLDKPGRRLFVRRAPPPHAGAAGRLQRAANDGHHRLPGVEDSLAALDLPYAEEQGRRHEAAEAAARNLADPSPGRQRTEHDGVGRLDADAALVPPNRHGLLIRFSRNRRSHT
jgi:hypothetical protein